MVTPSEEILPQLLSLPASERAKLAEKLLASLKEPDESTREAWAAETERRLDAFDKGEIRALPGEEVLARLRSRFPKSSVESNPTEAPQETSEQVVSAMRDAMNDEIFLRDLWETMN